MVQLINDNCGVGTAIVLNSGIKKQCVGKPVDSLFMTTETFQMANKATSLTRAVWDTGIQNKDIIPLYLVEEFSDNNTQQKKFEGRHEDYVTDEAVVGINYNSIVSDRGYEVLKSLRNSKYTRVFRALSDGQFHAELQTDGSIKGEPLSNYNLGVLIGSAIGGKPQNADIELKFKDYVKSTIKPAFDLSDLEGVQDVLLEVVGTPNATTLVVKATTLDRVAVGALVQTDFVALTTAGVAEPITGMTQLDGVYTLTGTFETGTIATIVAVTTNEMYEAGQTVFTA